MLNKTTSVILEVFIWVLIWVFFLFVGKEFNTLQSAITNACLNVFFLVLLAKLNSIILVPRLFNSRLILAYIISIVIAIFIYVLIAKELIYTHASVVEITINHKERGFIRHADAWMMLQILTLFFSVTTLFVSTAFALIEKIHKQEQLKMEIEVENKISELKLMTTQFSPHFFLNSLNNLYSISKLKPQKTSVFIKTLTSLMQYVTYEQMNDKVLLSKEIEFINDYIYFQQEKGENLFSVETHFENADLRTLIEPRLFIPFVENAFKFAYQPNKTMNVEISIETSGNKLKFKVNNEVSTHQRRNNEDGYFGVGIDSVRKLLNNLYPDKHELIISNSVSNYSVELILLLADG